MWLHHAPYILSATVSQLPQGTARIQVDIYKLTESREAEGSATLDRQKQITVSTQCSQTPRILCFQELCSSEDALMLPHLVIYDAALGQLECHRIDPKSQSLVARLGVDLPRIELCRAVSSESIVIASRSNRLDRLNGFDLFEWTPSQQRLLQGHLETDHIVGITESVNSQPWCLIYNHPIDHNRIMITQGRYLMSGIKNRGDPPPSIHVNAIPAEYRNNLQRIFISDRQDDSPKFQVAQPITTPFGCVWAQTRSGELVFFQHGVLQWSVAFSAPSVELTIAECQATERVSRLCLMVFTEGTSSLYDAMTGRLLKNWTKIKDNIILSDVRNVGLCSVMTLCGLIGQPAYDCAIYPSTTHSRTMSNAVLEEEVVARAKENLNIALGVLEQQLELKRKRVQRLQTSLVSKGEIIQGFQDLMDGPLRPTLSTGGVTGALNGATSRDENVVFEKKKEQRRKRVLERLIPIVGSTVAPSFLSTVGSGRLGVRNTELVDPLEVLECTSGWISSKSRGSIWFGARIRNQSNQILYNLHLSVAQQNSCGHIFSQMDPAESALLVGVISADSLAIQDDEFFDRSRAVKRILSNTVVLHFNQRLGHEASPDVHHCTIPIPTLSVREDYPSEWQIPLADIVLLSHVGCRLDGISDTRLSVLLQDGLGLSMHEGRSAFGALEEDLIARVTPSAHSENGGQQDSWDVVFQAPTDVFAMQAARKAILLCARYA